MSGSQRARLSVARLTLGPLETNSYLVSCPETREALVVDAGFEAQAIVEKALDEGLRVVQVVSTHGHIDHVWGNGLVREATGAKVAMHREDLEILLYPDAGLLASLGAAGYAPTEPDFFIEEGDKIEFGRQSLRVIHTPGHTPGSICLVGNDVVFSGDTLFAGSVGRTDLFGGDEEALLNSIRERLLTLPDETTVEPGHGPSTTVGKERRTNPFLLGIL